MSSTATAAPTSLSAFGTTWLDTTLGAENGAANNGKITQGTGNNASVAANTSSLGGNYAFLLVGWSANLGSSWSTVLGELNSWSTQGAAFGNNTANAAYFGISAFGSSAVVNPSGDTPGTPVIGSTAGLIYNPIGSPMQLDELGVAVPEPGTLALAALGGASLLLFRRKK